MKMNVITRGFINGEEESFMIKTTLYDLIDAISREVSPEEEELVIATVVHLLKSGRARFLDEKQHYN